MFKNLTNAKKKPEQEVVGNFPLFFKKPVPVDAQRHAHAGLLVTQDVSFAAGTNSIMLNAIEFFEASRHYPIVFLDAEIPLPVAIVGLEKKNYFVNSKNHWKEGAYIPAYVRKYPFIFMEAAERQQFVLCIDEAAPQFREIGGKDTLPLFKDGAATDTGRGALEFCTSYQKHYLVTQNFCAELKKLELLVPAQSDTKLVSGRDIHLGGFLAVDEKKINELPDETIVDFFKKGWLPLIYTALLSNLNWKTLADMAAEAEKKSKTH